MLTGLHVTIQMSICTPPQYLDLLNAYCNLILCNRNLFQNIGDYNKEDLNQERFEVPDYTLSVENFTNKYLSHTNNKLPIDDRHRKVAGLLRNIITYYIVYHELGHARQNSFNGLQEVAHEQSQKERWENQAIEVFPTIFVTD